MGTVVKVIGVVPNGPILASKTGKCIGDIYIFNMWDDEPQLNTQVLKGASVKLEGNRHFVIPSKLLKEVFCGN